jgi:hypothetical protein
MIPVLLVEGRVAFFSESSVPIVIPEDVLASNAFGLGVFHFEVMVYSNSNDIFYLIPVLPVFDINLY